MSFRAFIRAGLIFLLLGNVELLPANGEDCFDDCSPCFSNVWDAGIELAILQWIIPRDPGAVEQSDGAGDTYYKQPNGKYKASPRVWLSYLGQSGVGLRGQYFSYDSESERLEGVDNPGEFL